MYLADGRVYPLHFDAKNGVIWPPTTQTNILTSSSLLVSVSTEDAVIISYLSPRPAGKILNECRRRPRRRRQQSYR